MKRKKVFILSSAVIVVCIICIFLFSNKINTRLSSEYVTILEEFYGLSLPEKGESEVYEWDNNEYKLVEYRFNEKDYNDMIKQLEDKTTKDMEYDRNIKNLYGIEDDDIELQFSCVGGVMTSNDENSVIYGRTVHFIYVSVVDDGVFRVLFELHGIEAVSR